MKVILAIARKEFEDHVRSGWIVAIAVAFAVFALVISYAGFGAAGTVGMGDEAATLSSLASLAIYLVPLLGLLLGYDGIVGERERGTLDLLLSYPLHPVELLLGKWLGLAGVLVASLSLGLLLPAVLGVLGGQALGAWLGFFAVAVWLGLVFVSLALWLSTMAAERARLIGVVLGVWLLLVILFDLGMIGLLVASEGQVPPGLVSGLFFANPTSLFRFFNLVTLMPAEALAVSGLADAVPPTWSLVLGLIVWTLWPLGAAGWRMRRIN